MTMPFNFNAVVILACFLQVFVAGLNPGDSCTLQSTGGEGLCKFLTDCEPARKLIDEGGFPEDLCGMNGPQFIICCEDTTPVTKPPPRKEIPSPEVVTTYTRTNRETGEVTKKKCKKYAEYVWEKTYSPTHAAVPQISSTFECPFEKIPLIIGGTLASRQEFPHMALVGYNKGQEVEWSCGGSLISESYVLTAGHCIKHSRMGLAKLVRLGMTNQSDTTHMQELTISEVIFYPEYNTSARYHDIALLKLSQNVTFNTFVRPACLQVGREVPYKKAVATGWGNVGYTGDASNDLLKVVLEFFDNESCNSSYRRKINKADTDIKNGIVDDFMVCAGSHKEIKDTCQGDSGGPLQVYYTGSDDVKCMYNIVGVTSFGKACGLAKNTPGVYTRVSSYIKWIEDVVWSDEL